jgi:formate-dependent nitrite reductase membrane component NrfD
VSLKPPVWTWEVPAYFFVGGVAGAAAVIAGLARLAGVDPLIVRDARWIAGVGAVISPLLLTSDLGRPARFLNMLRVFKLQSPMSVGAWTLVMFSGAVFASLAIDLWSGPIAIGVVADVAAAIFGLVLSTYTGVLIGATAIPAWSRHATTLPILFSASALGSAVSLLELVGHRPMALNTIGLAAAAIETLASLRIDVRDGREGGFRAQSGSVRAQLTRGLAGPIPLILRIVGARSWILRTVAASCTIGGSIAVRFEWLAAGRSSARGDVE